MITLIIMIAFSRASTIVPIIVQLIKMIKIKGRVSRSQVFYNTGNLKVFAKYTHKKFVTQYFFLYAISIVFL